MKRSENFLLRRYVEKAMVDLPAMPNVIASVLEATERETVSTTEIEKLISADQAIITKLLKVVNSAYFGLPRQIGNINQAITILGLHQVRNLVLSIGVLNALTSPSPRIVAVQKRFWQHSFAGASAAQMLARMKGLGAADQELVYVAGLLHDIGRLFLFTLFNLPYQDVLRESTRKGEPLSVVEDRVLGTTHAELGGMLAEKWNFPQPLVEMVRDHECDEDVVGSPALYCIHVADRLADKIAGEEIAGPASPIQPHVLTWLGMNDDELKNLESEVQARVNQAAEMLGVL